MIVLVTDFARWAGRAVIAVGGLAFLSAVVIMAMAILGKIRAWLREEE